MPIKSLVAVLSLLILPVLQAAEPLYFGIPGAAGSQTLDRLWGPLLEDLGAAIGRPVSPRQFPDYASAVDAIDTGQVQLAWLGNRSAIDAVDRGRVEIFAQVLDPIGVPGYYSLLVTLRDQPFSSLADMLPMRGQISLGLGDKGSTSGTTAPLFFLFGDGDYSPLDFQQVRHANHEQNFLDVAAGRIDVATISSNMMRRFKERYPVEHDRLKVIWASPLIPSDPLLWHLDLEPDLREVVRAFFLGYGQAAGGKSQDQLALEQAQLQRMKWSGFKASGNHQLKYVRILDLFGQLRSAKEDPALEEGERQQRIAELEKRLAILQGKAP